MKNTKIQEARTQYSVHQHHIHPHSTLKHIGVKSGHSPKMDIRDSEAQPLPNVFVFCWRWQGEGSEIHPCMQGQSV